MRHLELVVIVATMVAALRPWVIPRRPGAVWWAALTLSVGIVPLGLAVLQVMVEGGRWQLAPVWVVAGAILVMALRDVRPSARRKDLEAAGGTPSRTYTIPLIVLALLGGGLAWALPVVELPAPEGPYAVGTTTMILTDGQRREAYGPNPGRLRQLPVQVWYPAEPAIGSVPARWFAERRAVTTAAARDVGLPAFALDHLSLVDSNAVANAPLAPQGPYPVVVYAHGWNGFRDIHAIQLESLASKGYIVASADHTYGALATVLPGGLVAELDPATLPRGVAPEEYDEASERLVTTFADDLELVLDAVLDGRLLGALLQGPEEAQEATTDASDTVLPGRDQAIDGQRVGMIGHSTGGGAAYLLCSRDERCGAAVGYDPWVEPIPDEVIGGSFPAPLLSVRSEEWDGTDNDARLRRLHAGSMAAEGRLRLEGTLHRDLTMLPLLSPLSSRLGIAGVMPAHDTLSIVDRWTVDFLDHHLRGQGPDPLNAPTQDDRVSLDAKRDED